MPKIALPDVEILAVCLFRVCLMYSPDGTNVYNSKGGKFEEIVCLQVGLKL